jgi:hypothetical protein
MDNSGVVGFDLCDVLEHDRAEETVRRWIAIAVERHKERKGCKFDRDAVRAATEAGMAAFKEAAAAELERHERCRSAA